VVSAANSCINGMHGRKYDQKPVNILCADEGSWHSRSTSLLSSVVWSSLGSSVVCSSLGSSVVWSSLVSSVVFRLLPILLEMNK
jgi:hypothetical protein